MCKAFCMNDLKQEKPVRVDRLFLFNQAEATLTLSHPVALCLPCIRVGHHRP
jgi:hypothetical protein